MWPFSYSGAGGFKSSQNHYFNNLEILWSKSEAIGSRKEQSAAIWSFLTQLWSNLRAKASNLEQSRALQTKNAFEEQGPGPKAEFTENGGNSGAFGG